MRPARFSDLCARSWSARLPSGNVTPLRSAVALDVDQFERAAAEVADDTVRIVDAGDDAKRGQFCFARAGQDHGSGAADALSLGDEVGAVGGVAAGGGRDRVDATDFLDAAQCVEAPQRRSAPWRPRPAANSPVLCTSRPSPHSAFSLNTVMRLRASDS